MISGTIESIAFGGDGVLKNDGLVIFMPFTAPQDQITLDISSKKKNFAFGTVHTVDVPSPHRTLPQCPHYGTCGGCQFQHLQYPAQLEAKRRFIADALQRIAHINKEIPPVIPAPTAWNYRCHITLRLKAHNQGNGNGFCAGYTGKDFIPIERCPIFCPSEDPILSQVQELASHLYNTGIEEATVRLIKAQEGYLLACAFLPHLPENIALCADFISHSIQGIFATSPLDTQHFGNTTCILESLGLSAHFSPYGFLQNFPEQRDTIYSAILSDHPKDSKKVLDLYCGIGLTSLLLARQGKTVIGVEVNPECIKIAEHNAKQNNVPNTTFYAQKAEKHIASLLQTHKPECVLCNPPREGLSSCIVDALLAHPPKYIQYLSCMPSTLARDLKLLIAGGYVLEKIQGFDMFPQTTHVETLCLLKR